MALLIFGGYNISQSQTTMIDSLKLTIQTANDYHDQVDLLIALSDYYKDTNPDSTLHYARYAQQIAERSKDTKLMMRLSDNLMKIALNFRKQRNLEAAERLISVVIALREKTEFDYLLIGPYINLCISFYNHRKYHDGIEAGKRANEISFKYLDSPDSTRKAIALRGLGGSCYWLGQIYYEKGEYSNAIKCFAESDNYHNIIENQHTKASSLIGNARIYTQQKNYPAAISNFETALVLFEEAGMSVGVFRTLRRLGETYMIKKDYSMALTYYMQTLSRHREYHEDIELHITYQMLGRLYLEIYRLSENMIYDVVPSLQMYSTRQVHQCLSDSAAYYLSTAYELSRRRGDKLIMAKSLLGLAELSYLNQKFERAVTQLNEAILLAKKIDAWTVLTEAYKHLSVISEKLSHFEDALNYFKFYEAFKDSVFMGLERQIADLHYKYEMETKDQENELLRKNNELLEEKSARQKLLHIGIAIIVFLLLLIDVLIFRSQRLKKKLEKQAAVINERNRISADLHDDIGTGLSKISLLSEFVRTQAKLPETKKEATKIADTSKKLLQNIGEIIWALNSNNDFIDNMLAYIRHYAAEYFENLPLDLKITMPNSIPRTPISGESRRNIFFTVKEALYNIVKHAQATEVKLKFSITDHALIIVIHDNGIGIPQDKLNQFGNGLRNMHERMANINGKIDIGTQKGTKITLTVPIKKMQHSKL